MEIEEIKKILPEPDVEYLQEKQYVFDVHETGGDNHVIIHGFPFLTYQPVQADLMIILPAGYPNGKLDMFWTYPDIKLSDGNWPRNCEVHADYHGKSWQRWSRHLAGDWRPGVDNLRTYMASVITEIKKGI